MPALRRWMLRPCLGLLLACLLSTAFATGVGPMPLSLRGVAPPPVPGLLDGPTPIVIDRAAAIALGKALFWDVAVGADGMACASCHFHAGADARTRNQMAPSGQHGQPTFELATSGAPRGPNDELRRGDFPLIETTTPLDEASSVGLARRADEVAGSGGSFGGAWVASELSGSADDSCLRAPDAVFHRGAVGTRAVTARNAPSVINAVFFERGFWDGHASNVFNGSSELGERDADAGVWVKAADGGVRRERLALINSALASQAVAPPRNTVEMACAGRGLADLGRKLLMRRPLASQRVHPDDSVLGALSFSQGSVLTPGLRTFYLSLVRQAFASRYWSSPLRGPFGAPASASGRTQPYSQAEANFGMFFAIALQLYQATLISDDAPIDRSRRDASGVPIDLSAAQLRGLGAFRTAHCNVCHVGPLFTAAAVVTNAALAPQHPEGFGDSGFRIAASLNVVDRARGIGGPGLVDTGFAAIGVTPASVDRGVGGEDSAGRPLSYARQYLAWLTGDAGAVLDSAVGRVRPCDFTLALARDISQRSTVQFTRVDGVRAQAQPSDGCFNPGGAYLPTPAAAARELANPATRKLLTVVDGAFKIPSLRNVELTGPFMHNGGMATLEQVIEFYARGGNFDEASKQFGLVFAQPDLQLDASLRRDLLDFLTTLTDDRVRYERAPFDHPELTLRHGHRGDAQTLEAGHALGASLAQDRLETVPAVGAAGRATPLPRFDQLLTP